MFGFPISFGTPLILAVLIALPVLWWLLRVTPPLPRRTLFPPLRLLRVQQRRPHRLAACWMNWEKNRQGSPPVMIRRLTTILVWRSAK